MLIKIGESKEPSDVVDMLVACHDRIRFFVDLARRLAEAQNSSPSEIQDAAARVIRYFSESLPLHVADEEESIIPRLSGKDAELDASLQAMHREHQDHEPHLQLLLKTCRAIEAQPERLNELRETLHTTSSALEREFAAHLNVEEKSILPAIRSLLSIEEREAMLDELRARRNR